MYNAYQGQGNAPPGGYNYYQQQQQQHMPPQQPNYMNNQQQQPMQNTNYQSFQAQQPSYAPMQQQTGYISQQQQQQQQQQQPGYSNVQQQSGFHNMQPQLQQMPSIQPQSTGYYANAGLVPPATPVQQLQPLKPQSTGFLQPPQQPLQPQQTGFYLQQQQTSQVPLEPLKPTATGFVNSFANNGLNNDLKIPTIRLSFITANDQAKFETLFRSMVKPGSNTIKGVDCRQILMKSGLQPQQLAKIWSLCDTSRAGELLFPEFALAMHLVNDVLQGDSIPYELDSKTKNEVNSFIDAINLHIAAASNTANTPFDDLMRLQPQNTGLMPQTSFGMMPQVTGGTANPAMLNPQSTGFMPPTSFGMAPQLTGGVQAPMLSQVTGGNMMPMAQTSFNTMPLQNQMTGSGLVQPQVTGGMAPSGFNQQMPQLSFGQNTLNMNQTGLQPQATGYLPPSNFNVTAPLAAQKTGFGNNEIYSQSNFNNNRLNISTQEQEETISPEEKSLFYKIFETYDSSKRGLLDSPTAVEIFRKSGLNRSDLEHIWNLCDINNSGQLNKQEFALGMHLVYKKLNGFSLPNTLPKSLIPSSMQILDNLKNQLKLDNNINSTNNNLNSRIDALNFKNNDDEDSLPVFRNRRKTNTAEAPLVSSAAAVTSNDNNVGSMSVETAAATYPDITKTSINELQQNTAPVPANDYKPTKVEPLTAATMSSTSQEDAVNIEKLKNDIKQLNIPLISTANSVPVDVKKRFNQILTKVPNLFAEIEKIDNQIANAKIELFKLKNPLKIEGTGPNGEITDNDRKKARSKALLKARMAALTGETVDPSSIESDDSEQLSKEVSRIKDENMQNQQILKDVRLSISEMFASLKATLTGKNIYNNIEDFEKYEFGVGLEPEVRSFIEALNSEAINNSISSTGLNPSGSTISSPDISSNEASYSQFKSSEERAAYLKEQAQKRMKERLAKFGLDRRDSRQRTNSTDQNKTPFEAEQSRSIPQQQPIAVQTSIPQNVPHQDEDESDEDEEEKKLREELQRLKLKKKADKERRLAELRSQVQDAKADSEDEWQDAASRTSDLTPAPINTAQVNGNNMPTQNIRTINVQEQNRVNTTPPIIPAASTTTPGQRNPFFKQETNASTSSSLFNAEAAEAQRRLQRGLDNGDDDGWSDDEVDEEPRKSVPVNNQSMANSVSYSQPTSVAPPLPQINNAAPPTPAPVAAAVPLSQMDHNTIQTEVTQAATPPVPVAPPLPTMQAAVPPVPLAPPLPTVETTSNFVPPPPPLPQLNNPVNSQNLTVAHDEMDGNYSDDVLSIPESVASDNEDGSNLPPAGIPPPPPLPPM
ncbi:hypothetical protein KAFR_0L00530 [Kazachstania africana CBS 2517]|uniref:Actin cytoskeleton-regulatory complex protein PAN1 n=1 Tax=Kazachstania africana (strain ATCC 22294 / BCRC 22015 / CBS 2517 / CECT 1963 / NBRC 1671 / NRRL Y-8276) TaxID=1071382 RepID=H2B210_KAZAF|nr:hypothetical protein KAFR_0L00530 [Kazachstania africana CBS 2517]CCF60660.1 hypothetical protein KAFR_0L00530 [Kazachstania africana CBS 2517]